MKKDYHSQIYKGLQAFIVCFLILTLFIGLIIWVAVVLNSPIFGVVGFIFFCTIPFIFQKQIKRCFAREVLLYIDDATFSISIFKKNAIKKTLSFEWDEIKEYKFYFTANKLTCLDIYLKNGRRREFAFKDQKDQDESIKPGAESIFNLFHDYVNNYNLNRSSENKIELRPPFLTTRAGGIFLSLVAVLMCVTIVLLIVSASSDFGFLFMAGLIFLPLLVKRKNDKIFYDKITRLQQ